MPYDPFAGAISTLADAQAYQRERLALIAAEHETAGIVADALITPTPGSPEVFATDADSVSRLREVVWLLEAGTIATAQWASESGTWYTLEPADTSPFALRLAAACVSYVQACRDHHQSLDDDIGAAASASACLAIDLSAGWPSRSVAVPAPLPVTYDDFLALVDTPSSYSGQGGKIVAVKGDASGLEFIANTDTFLELTDTPSSYSGSGSKFVAVNSGASGIEFVDAPEASPTLAVNSQSGASYTLVLADAGAFVVMTSGSANAVEVPPNSSVAFPTGTPILIGQYGAGQTTVQAGSGVTIRSPETLKIRKRYGQVALVKIGTDEWMLEGNLATT